MLGKVQVVVFEATKPEDCTEMNKFLKGVDVIQVSSSAAAYGNGDYSWRMRNYVTIVYTEKQSEQ